jgi:hypothetical protein
LVAQCILGLSFPSFLGKVKEGGLTMKHLVVVAALCLSLSARAGEAPAHLERYSYWDWLDEIGSVASPYLEPLFDWYGEQVFTSLPPETWADPELLHVSVDRPLRETIQAEAMGDVERGVTYGLETYGVIDAPIETTLETILFRWGKPIGRPSGVTYPVDTVFSFREERLEPFWGPMAYRTETSMRGGGIAKDQNDVSSLLVFGNSEDGYVIVGQFFGPKATTASTSSMSFTMLRPLPDGRTDYRVSGRYTGQSYLIFGIDFGRRNYGFNISRIRAAQKDFFGMVAELKATGKITERRPD